MSGACGAVGQGFVRSSLPSVGSGGSRRRRYAAPPARRPPREGRRTSKVCAGICLWLLAPARFPPRCGRLSQPARPEDRLNRLAPTAFLGLAVSRLALIDSSFCRRSALAWRRSLPRGCAGSPGAPAWPVLRRGPCCPGPALRRSIASG